MLLQKRRASPRERRVESLTAPLPALQWDRIRKDLRFQHLLVTKQWRDFHN
jgi:hypothetical protein